jgi:hypothetical protein
MENLPRVLYRVESSSSVSRSYGDEGIIAGDRTWHRNDFDDNEAMEIALGRHLDWNNRHHTPFISTSDDFSKTLKEANRREGDPRETDVRVIIIDPLNVEICGGQVMNVGEVLEKRGLSVPDGVRRWVTKSEWVALSRIPSEAILDELSVEKFTEFSGYDWEY